MFKKMVFGKILQLIGLVQVLFGLFYGFQGEMMKELILVLDGVILFLVGRWVEKRRYGS